MHKSRGDIQGFSIGAWERQARGVCELGPLGSESAYEAIACRVTFGFHLGLCGFISRHAWTGFAPAGKRFSKPIYRFIGKGRV